MAIIATIDTNFGETRDLYVRINQAHVSNNGQASTADLLGYISEDAYRRGASPVYESTVRIIIDVTKPSWPQYYDEYCKQYGLASVEV